MKTKTKKVFVFILEGYSDKTALEGILKRIYTNRFIYSVVTYGDITSNIDIDIEDLEELIYKTVKQQTGVNKIKMSDIINIIQICDTDGVYIPDSNIVCGENKNFIYTVSNIITSNIKDAKKRNKHKREAITYLLHKDKIKNIPYQLFYMSCNLDHVLYNEQNLNETLKVDYADNFFKKFQNRPMDFIPFIKENAFNVPENYTDSWNYIAEELHSLERHNNLFICFNSHPPFAQ